MYIKFNCYYYFFYITWKKRKDLNISRSRFITKWQCLLFFFLLFLTKPKNLIPAIHVHRYNSVLFGATPLNLPFKHQTKHRLLMPYLSTSAKILTFWTFKLIIYGERIGGYSHSASLNTGHLFVCLYRLKYPLCLGIEASCLS